MKFDLDQAIENGDPVNDAEICAKHLGTTSRYIRATKKLDETGEELAATKKKLNKQEKMIDWMKDIVIEKFGMTLPTLCLDDESGDGFYLLLMQIHDARTLVGFKGFTALRSNKVI
ncbi:hypothetical protein ACH5RR_003382 [Cinchona calisaya]|uniref:Uncharacterized protein n=1 Tax=Cinchona calisaya TaxID=153742 RepID=A0ABD3AV05_9GENT